MTYTQILREFWTVPTLEQAKHERVTVPPQPDAWTDEVQSEIVARVLGDVALLPGARIVDYGAGVGRLARQVARRGCRVVAVDVSAQMLAYCRDYCAGLPNIEYVLCDGYGVSALDNATVDGAYSFFVFQHMPCLDMARSVLADLYRMLKPGGWCKIQTVDTRADIPVTQVGFHGERQTAAFLLEAARASGFRNMRLSLDIETGMDYLVLLAIK